MSWRRHNARPSTSPISDDDKVIDLRADDAQIAEVARAAGEDPHVLIREVRAFRNALPQQHAFAAAVDSVAVGAFTLREQRGPNQRIPVQRRPVDLDEHRPGVGARTARHRVLSAAAGLLVVAMISGTTVAVVANENRPADRSRVQGLELHAAQQYGVLALAVQDRSSGQIVAASVALHASLLPLLHEARTDAHAAKTAMLLLTNERALLMNSSTQDASIATALHQTQSLLIQLQNTTKTPVPDGPAPLPTVVLPPPGPTPGPTPPVVPSPTSVPSTPVVPTIAPTVPPVVTTPTPPPPSSTPDPEPTPTSILLPQATPNPTD